MTTVGEVARDRIVQNMMGGARLEPDDFDEWDPERRAEFWAEVRRQYEARGVRR